MEAILCPNSPEEGSCSVNKCIRGNCCKTQEYKIKKLQSVQNARIQDKILQKSVKCKNTKVAQNVQYLSIARTANAPEEDRYSASCQQSLCSGRRRPQPIGIEKTFCFLESKFARIAYWSPS